MTKNFNDADTKMILTPKWGSNVQDCISEACIIALTEDVKIEFVLNNRLVFIDPVEILNLYYKQFHNSDD
jgi:hypothetical protein